MSKEPRIQVATEKYYCINCEKYFDFSDVHSNWKCPECEKLVNIKVSIGNYFHNCQRVNPNELKIDEFVTMENEHIHQIINIVKQGENYRVALKNYTAIPLSSEDIITRINGSWSED